MPVLYKCLTEILILDIKLLLFFLQENYFKFQVFGNSAGIDAAFLIVMMR